MKDNQLKRVHYLVKHEEVKYKQKNDCHPILADYGDDQFSIRINNKGEEIHIKPLDSFSFQSIVPFESKYKKTTKNQGKSLLQQSTILKILNDTDILSDEDEITQSNNIQQQNSDIQYVYILLYNILPNPTIVNNKFHFLIHLFSNTKNILITSSYQKIHK